MVNKTLEKLKVIISAETSKFKNALKDATNEARNSANSVENSTSRMGKAVSGIKGLVAKAAAGFGLYKLGKEAIEVASNITEVQSVWRYVVEGRAICQELNTTIWYECIKC